MPDDSANTSTASSTPNRISVYQALGGGLVADVLLWRRRNLSVAIIVGGTIVWYIFERAGYNILSLLANAVLLLITILFFWAKSASLLNRPLPPLPKLEVSDSVVEKVADKVQLWINTALNIALDIAVSGDKQLFLKVICFLWVISYIGDFFNFMTFLYIGFLACFLLPVLYDENQDAVHEKLCFAQRHYRNILDLTGSTILIEHKSD